jgi:hypothetical protein
MAKVINKNLFHYGSIQSANIINPLLFVKNFNFKKLRQIQPASKTLFYK